MLSQISWISSGHKIPHWLSNLRSGFICDEVTFNPYQDLHLIFKEQETKRRERRTLGSLKNGVLLISSNFRNLWFPSMLKRSRLLCHWCRRMLGSWNILVKFWVEIPGTFNFLCSKDQIFSLHLRDHHHLFHSGVVAPCYYYFYSHYYSVSSSSTGTTTASTSTFTFSRPFGPQLGWDRIGIAHLYKCVAKPRKSGMEQSAREKETDGQGKILGRGKEGRGGKERERERKKEKETG